MNVNKFVIASTLIIMGVGIVHAWTATPPQGITRVVIGGYVFMFVLSIFDLFGGGLAQIANALALLAVVFVLLYEGLPIVQQLGILTGGTTAASGPGRTPATPNTTPVSRGPGAPGVNPSA